MARQHHFEHHRREALVNKRRFAFANAFLISLLVVAVYWIYHASLASSTLPVHQMYYSETVPVRIYTLYPNAFAGSYHDEGPVFHAFAQPAGNTVPIWQWHKDGVGYIYTQCASGCFESQGWVPDAVAFHAYGGAINGAVAIHQQHIGSVPYFIYTTCSTCFTSSGWIEDGIAFYAFANPYSEPTPPPSTPPPSTPPPSTPPPSTPPPSTPPPSVPVPTVNISASATTVYQYTGLTVSWNSSNASSCSGSGTTWSGGKGGSGSEDRSGDTGAIRTLTYTLTCSNSSGSRAASVNVNVIKSAAPTAPSGVGVDQQTSASVRLSWRPSVAAQGSTIDYYQVRNSGGAVIANTSQTNFVVSGLAACKTYAFSIVAVNNQATASSPSPNVNASTNGCPTNAAPTPAPPAPKQSSSPPPAPGVRKTVTGTVSSSSSATPAVVPDATPPGTPGNFKASLGPDGSVIELSWDATSDDNSGVRGYLLERSLDQSKWEQLQDNITDTTYTDKAAAFKTHYYYRLKAYDNAGNASPETKVDILTGDFNTNVSSELGSIIKSDDGIVSVDMPQGSTDKDAACSVSKDDENKQMLNSTKLHLVVGPYSLVCKTASGDVANIQSSVTVTLNLSKQQKYQNFQGYQYDATAANWIKANGKYNSKAKNYSFNLTGATQFAVMGAAKKSYWGLILSILIPILLLFGGAFFYRLRQLQRQQYNEYLRRKYYNL